VELPQSAPCLEFGRQCNDHVAHIVPCEVLMVKGETFIVSTWHFSVMVMWQAPLIVLAEMFIRCL
jgi:hypothetical protein